MQELIKGKMKGGGGERGNKKSLKKKNGNLNINFLALLSKTQMMLH